jgi:hypothetical protein
MLRSDWLMRQIEMLGEFLRQIRKLIAEGRHGDALELSEEAIGEVFDTDPDLVLSLTGSGIVALLSAGGEEDAAFRSLALGEILVARIEALEASGRSAEAAEDRERARTVLESAVPLADDEGKLRILDLLAWLDDGGWRA